MEECLAKQKTEPHHCCCNGDRFDCRPVLCRLCHRHVCRHHRFGNQPRIRQYPNSHVGLQERPIDSSVSPRPSCRPSHHSSRFQRPIVCHAFDHRRNGIIGDHGLRRRNCRRQS